MTPEILEAIFPVKSEWLTLAIEPGQTISALATSLELRLVCWEWDDQAQARTVNAIYQQETQLLPEDAVEHNQERVENYLLALGLTLEKVFAKQDTFGQAREASLPLLLALKYSFRGNHPLLLAKANTVEDFVKALETKGRLGRWL